MRRILQRPAIIILLLWSAITALDLNKAFHIDDTFHLQAARWIERHPADPMTGVVQWGNGPEPLHHFNQPPGFFYLVALTGHVFGYHEAPLHAMRSLFTLLALACMYRLARHRAPGQALLLTALFALCPAFMVNQGLMTDVPLLAMVLLFAVLLLVPGKGAQGRQYAWAGLALSGALMIKYSALPLLVVFPLALALRREWRCMPAVLIPVAVLAAWSAWNLHEYGGIHLLGRQGGDPSPNGIFVRNLALFTALGAVAPFTPAFLGAFFKPLRQRLAIPWTLLLSAAVLFTFAVWRGLVTEARSDQVLRLLFTLNGVFIMGLCVRFLPRPSAPARAETCVLAAWAFGMALFLVLFAPAMATRHLLPLLPPILLLSAPALDGVRTATKVLALSSTALLGVLLTVSDKAYADFYRKQAPHIAAEMQARTTGTVWCVGHWGWQWYAGKAGMPPYGTSTSPVQAGDMIVVPQDHDAQPLAAGLVVRPIAAWAQPPGPATFFNVAQYAGMYTSSYEKLPWRLSRTHRMTITAYRVEASP